MSGKLAKKLAKPVLIPQPDGKGALLSGGVPGHKGAGGRPPDEFTQWLGGLLDSPDNRRVFEAYLKSGNLKAWDIAMKYTKQLPAQKTEISGPDGGDLSFTLKILESPDAR